MPDATFREEGLRHSLRRLDDLGPEGVSGMGYRAAAGCLSYGDNRRRVAAKVLRDHPEAAWVLSTDADGYIREAAIRKLRSPPTSAGRFVALTLRLNDWVPQVREAARIAAANLFPLTAPDTVAAAAPYVLGRRHLWARWGQDERSLIDAAFLRADVMAALTERLVDGRSGGLAGTLRNALRTPGLDGELLRLAFDARSPAVRALALRTLLEGRATWTAGYAWAWQDKALGIRRRVPRMEGREVAATLPAPALIRRGLADRSALVRRVAASALIARADEMPDAAELATALARDPSASVRDRAAFLLRDLAARQQRNPEGSRSPSAS